MKLLFENWRKFIVEAVYEADPVTRAKTRYRNLVARTKSPNSHEAAVAATLLSKLKRKHPNIDFERLNVEPKQERPSAAQQPVSPQEKGSLERILASLEKVIDEKSSIKIAQGKLWAAISIDTNDFGIFNRFVQDRDAPQIVQKLITTLRGVPIYVRDNPEGVELISNAIEWIKRHI